MRRIASLAAVATLLCLATLASAHGAPPPASYETRLLHDHNDDAPVMLAGKHGFDAIALDVREAFVSGVGNVLVTKLILNGGCKPSEPGTPNPDPNDPFSVFGELGGYDPIAAQSECGTLTMRVSFDTNSTTHSFDYVTADGGGNWTGDAILYRGPFDLNDGTRFAVEAWVPFSTLNVTSGTTTSNWFVEGYWGDTETDHMPAGTDNSRGTDDATGPIATAFDYGDYVLQAPDYYLSASGPSELALSKDEPRASLAFNVTNLLPDAQSVQLFARADNGDFIFEYPGSSQLDLAANGTGMLEMAIDASAFEQSASHQVTVYVVSSLGGAVMMPVNVSVDVPAMHDLVVSEDLLPGQSFSYTFMEAGTFQYHNHHTPKLMAAIHVEESADVTAHAHTVSFVAADNAFGAAFDPAALTVAVGDTVTWTNDHTQNLIVMGSMGAMDHGEHHEGGNHEDHGEHGHDEESPGAPLVLLLGALALLAFLRRR